MYPEERILIDKELKKRNLEHLKCDYLYLCSYNAVIDILDLPYWNDPKFKVYSRQLYGIVMLKKFK